MNPAGTGETHEVGRLADRIAEAVAGCPDVAALAGGPVATYLAGRSVAGVAVREKEVEVALVARYGRPLGEIAADVRTAVEALAPGLTVNIRVEDITLPDPGTGPSKPEPGTGPSKKDITRPASGEVSPERSGDAPVSP
ncbi:hypothetical protein GCM10022226_14680 [Sphaerisporangium flaviroseum]|uniref:Asp23/Gls24 family envelope stress response protein n=1 Tax=Sphaerisporangium flaviroseum TaxID=509199 RepID=A0ABP7HJ64_9ACTN